MALRILLGITLTLFFIDCTENTNHQNHKKNEYKNYLKDFETKLTTHFPSDINSAEYLIIDRTEEEKNNIGMLLYEYNLQSQAIDSIIRNTENLQIIGKYQATDTCLLVVNRFETKKTQERHELSVIDDSTKIERECYTTGLPIPNFIDYPFGNGKIECKLDDSFVLYVLEADTGKYLSKYNLQPSPQMPNKWKNGHSKGIAISKAKSTVIYWGIVW